MNIFKLTKTVFVLILVFLFINLILIKTAYASVADWQQGASIQPTYSTDFSSDSFKQSLAKLAATGANYVTLIIPYYQPSLDSSNIYAGANTPTDQSLIDAINYAHSLGMRVMLKPHIDVATGEWRAMINATDRDGWYASYGAILNKYASIANQYQVEEISVGAELYRMAAQTQNYNNTQRWNQLISDIRARYSGSLTYSANHTSPAEENEIQFWSSLDYIGVSAYFALAPNQTSPTAADLQNSWAGVDSQIIRPLYQTWNKPILFTEVGYKSVSGANTEPWAWWRSGSQDQAGQANLYEALFAYWNNQSYFQGVHLWDWKSTPYPSGVETDYTPQNKLAEGVMVQWFGAGFTQSTPSPTAFPTALPTPTNIPSPTPTSAPIIGTNQLLTSPWSLRLFSPGAVETYQAINQNVLQGNTNLSLTYNLHGLCILGGDASAIIFDQGGSWHYISLSNYGQNCLDREQTVNIPLSNFPGLNLSLPVGNFHSRFWFNGSLAVDITSAIVSSSSAPAPTPAPSPIITPSPIANPTVSPTPTPSPSITPTPTPTSTPAPITSTIIDVWWPSQGVTLSGVQPFKALLQNTDTSKYAMFWQVDGGQLNQMGLSTQDYPHYESLVDLSGWGWNSNGPYTITFIAKDLTSNQVASTSRVIYISH